VEELETLVRSTIPHLAAPFDTHKLILELAQRNQRQYIAALQQVRGDAPFQTLHSMIGRTLQKLAPEFGLVGRQTFSDDIFRQRNSCVEWSRS
jgi:hypothetical protein